MQRNARKVRKKGTKQTQPTQRPKRKDRNVRCVRCVALDGKQRCTTWNVETNRLLRLPNKDAKCVCLPVGLLNYSNKYERILTIFGEGVSHGPKRKCLNFGGYAESVVDSRSAFFTTRRQGVNWHFAVINRLGWNFTSGWTAARRPNGHILMAIRFSIRIQIELFYDDFRITFRTIYKPKNDYSWFPHVYGQKNSRPFSRPSKTFSRTFSEPADV